MKINELTRLLDGIGAGLTAIAPKASDGLASFSRAMTPFADKTIEQMEQFLSQCEEYQRTGIVPGGKKSAAKGASAGSSFSIDDAARQFHGLLAEINHGTVTTAKIEGLVNNLNGMKKPDVDRLLGMLEIAGKSKSKSDAIDKIRNVLTSQAQMYIKVSAVE